MSIRRRLERLEAGAGESAAQWENLRDMHPSLRQKHLDEARGYSNYTVPPDLSRLYALGDPRLSKGVLHQDGRKYQDSFVVCRLGAFAGHLKEGSA